jgi:tRNA(adenine34) deaminase
MRRALDEAALAAAHGDVPIGCVIVAADGTELARAHNRRELDADPTAHAEILALRAAARVVGHWRLEGASVFVTLEPCPMCAGALVNARAARLVYAAADPKAGAVDSLFSIGKDTRLNHRFEVTGGVLADESAALLRAFFAELRAAGQK